MQLEMAKFGSFLEPLKQFVDFLRQGGDQRSIFFRERRENPLAGIAFRGAQCPRQLLLKCRPLISGGVEGSTLRFYFLRKGQEGVSRSVRTGRVLGLQQGEHRTVLLQFATESINEGLEWSDHQSMTEEQAKP